jgi:hypothetical protein
LVQQPKIVSISKRETAGLRSAYTSRKMAETEAPKAEAGAEALQRPTNCVRLFFWKIAVNPKFDAIILLSIAINCFFMAIEVIIEGIFIFLFFLNIISKCSSIIRLV